MRCCCTKCCASAVSRRDDISGLVGHTGLVNLLIVDGYNVVHAWPRLNQALSERGLEDARRLLVQALSEYAAQTDSQVTVVFDAHARAPSRDPAEVVDGVTVRYGTRSASADHVIERLASEAARRGDARDVVVVTGDRLQGAMVGAMGIATLRPNVFEAEVERVAAAVSSGSRFRRADAAGARRVEHQLTTQVRRRLEALRRGRPSDLP